MTATHGEDAVNLSLRRARAYAPFLRRQLDVFPEVAAALDRSDVETAIAAAKAAGERAPSLDATLRRERNALALALAIGDLAGKLPLERVVRELSDCADRLLNAAIRGAIMERSPEAEPRGFAAIALGKLGGHELNFSSDIDIILLYDPATLPLRRGEDASRAAVRIGQRVVEALQRRDADGYAFRVDLRLRPSPEVTPIVLPVDAAISYYESSALAWERAAFIRARFAGGDEALGAYFLNSIQPFVWRRSLDFGAVGELRAITGRIRDHYAEGQAFGPGFDLKRGRGGIREIEFFAQIHQLIHGGRDPMLRVAATLDALPALAAAGWIKADEADLLSDAYRLFRTIEHRLQMVEDKQTHSLPTNPEALDNVAALHGLASGEALLALLRPAAERVAEIYGALADEEQSDRLPTSPEALEARLAAAGFQNAIAARLRIESWRSGKARSLRTAPAQGALESMLPDLVRSFGAAPDPIRAMNRFDDIVAKLPSGINFYRLLVARPELMEMLASLLSHAPALAEQLGRRPELMDGLIDQSAFDPAPSVEELIQELCRGERPDEEYQAVLDRVRRQVNEKRFALGAQLVLGRSDPIDVAEGNARLAEAAIRRLADAATREFERAHGKVPGGELLILGLGRLGGEALSFVSDLDLIYIFTGFGAVSDGPRALSATDYFNRLAPRITAALSVPTAAGPLYDVDTRLRPSGKDGMLAVSLESFAQYQIERAWTFEHMALTRARPVYGSEEGRARLQEIVGAALRKARDRQAVFADAARMRVEIARHKPPSGPFDIKLGEGGLVDLEFAIQTLQLSRGVGLHPRLEHAADDLAAAELVPREAGDWLRLLSRFLFVLRLVSPTDAEPPAASQPLVARACGHRDWVSLLAALGEARQRVSELWRRVAAGE